MSKRNESYDKLKRLTQARLGKKITQDDEEDFQFLVNDALRSLYDRSPYWPRYLRLEPRTVERGYIADDEGNTYNVSGAGFGEVNGLYKEFSTSDGVPSFRYQPSIDEPFPRYNLQRTSGTWEIEKQDVTESGAVAELIYFQINASDTPPADGWVINSSGPSPETSSPTPLIQMLGKIEQIIWQFSGNKWNSTDSSVANYTYGPALLKNYRDSNGIRSTNGPTDGIVYVAYKMQIEDEIGDGTSGTVAEVPYEFFRFIALYVAYQMQRSQRTTEPNPTYTIAYQDVEAAAQDALLGITREGAEQTIANFHRTYYNYDVSIRS